ncbi:HNH endonuclease signature motif containing protein [Aeromicrobium halocynthiae]|uniref:HNH endonuclease signature motif containing protein n=1 Tax=Aeromicrobium halocynthiae TaxID=560557 RepID=A0ABN2VRX1_9ACTN
MEIDIARPEDVLARAARVQACSEAASFEAMLAYRDAELARIDADPSPMRRMVERSMIAVTIGEAMGLSEAQVTSRLAVADRVVERAPACWLAFRSGQIDAARVREISTGLDRLEREESWARLDASVLRYATTHTTAELRAWIKRFVTRVEPDLALERAEKARDERYVQVTHLDDGMSWLSAYLPSHQAAAVMKRLDRAARTPLGEDDRRTLPQRTADLFVSWLTHGETTDAPTVTGDVAVTIEADVLTGLVDGHAESSDGEWSVPASWILEEIDADDTFWHRIITDPISGDTLAHDYAGRFAPEVLAKAIRFRDGVCRAPGCRVPAERCDLDHREPWPTGATNGSNMWALCRRHHSLKGHGVLQWILPTGRTVENSPREHVPRPGPGSTLEHDLARLAMAVLRKNS